MNKTESFIEKAKKVHGDKYDYSKVEYKNNRTPVCIICPTHGEFWQKPYNHLKSNGCPSCSGYKKSNTKEFIEKACKTHGDKYNYDKVEYITNKIKVCIICPEHGEFWQIPKDHVKGNGCPKCSGKYMDLEYFIEKSTKVHGNTYDYSKVVYKTVNDKVCIICPIHGEFWMTPSNHMHGQNCPKCAHDKQMKTQDTFEEEIKKLYGEKYDISNIYYNGHNKKLKIICPEHGEFWQTPQGLLQGHACPICSGYKSNINNFIKTFTDNFGDKYDLSKVEYVNNQTKVCVICHKLDKMGNEHGEFWMTPSNLLHGYGCPKCANVYKRNNVEFIEYANFIHNNEYDYSKTNFERANKKIEIICHKKDSNGVEHGSFWQTPNKHLNGRGCPKCGAENRPKERKPFDEFKLQARLVHGDKYDYLEYTKMSAKAKMYCHEKDENGNEHGEFWQLPANHLKGRGCPKCRSSHLEEKVGLFLERNNVKYTREQTFEWLKKHNYLPLDFFLPDYNIAIECQGKQHYEPVNFGGKMTEEKQQENLKIQLINDQFKKDECEKHGIRIIYVTYKDENVNDIISSQLNLET